MNLLLSRELADVNKQAEAEQRELTTHRQRLNTEREKLLQGHYAGAVPLDLLKQEQDRIGTQLAAIERRLEAATLHYDQIQTNLNIALELAEDCYRAYSIAPDHIRRLFNQAFFTHLFVEDDGTIRADLAEPFRTLLDGRLAETAHPLPDEGISAADQKVVIDDLINQPSITQNNGTVRRSHAPAEHYAKPPACIEHARGLKTRPWWS